MWIYFDKTGKAIKQLEHGTIARQGSVGVYTINAVFEDTDLSEYSEAEIKFEKPDGTNIETIYYMTKTKKTFVRLPSEYGSVSPFVSEMDYDCFAFTVNESGIFSQSGLYRVTIVLRSPNLQDVKGIFSISVQSAIVIEPLITKTQYDLLIDKIDTKADKTEIDIPTITEEVIKRIDLDFADIKKEAKSLDLKILGNNDIGDYSDVRLNTGSVLLINNN